MSEQRPAACRQKREKHERDEHEREEPALAALLLSIAAVNVFNRLNVATRQVAGAGW